MVPEPARRGAGQDAQADSVLQADGFEAADGEAPFGGIDEHHRQSRLQKLLPRESVLGMSLDRTDQRPEQHAGHQA
jgi:hypothetical protein